MGVECARFHGIVNGESLGSVFCCLLCIFYCWTTPILKTVGQFENLVFVIMSTRENIRLIARTPSFMGKPLKKMSFFSSCWNQSQNTYLIYFTKRDNDYR